MTVMIVDDSLVARTMMKDILSGLADGFYECSDGTEAFAAYARFQPDWVLMDVKMNTMDGFAATEELKAAFPGARVIIVTQYDDPLLEQRAIRSGALGLVRKENLTALQSIIRESPR